MQPVKVMLLCSNRLALPVLQELLFVHKLCVVAVPKHCDEWIENLQVVLQFTGIPVVLVEKASCAQVLTEAFEQYKPALALAISFSFKIPTGVLSLPVHGFFNVHPGPLPLYRGADPVFQQIRNREKLAGVTIHKMDENLDSGPVFVTEMIRLDPAETYGMLLAKLGLLAARLVLVLLKLADAGFSIPLKPQDEPAAVYYKKPSAVDVSIRWQTMDGTAIIALIHACNPWNKGALAMINQKIVRLLEAVPVPQAVDENTVPGTILGIEEKGITIATIQGAILVTFIYTEEGFLPAARLAAMGIMEGSRFE
jgi:methionyl-tRNA formyltransferase